MRKRTQSSKSWILGTALRYAPGRGAGSGATGAAAGILRTSRDVAACRRHVREGSVRNEPNRSQRETSFLRCQPGNVPPRCARRRRNEPNAEAMLPPCEGLVQSPALGAGALTLRPDRASAPEEI